MTNYTVKFILNDCYTVEFVVSDAPDRLAAKHHACSEMATQLANNTDQFCIVTPYMENSDDTLFESLGYYEREVFIRKAEIHNFYVISISANYEEFVETTAKGSTERVTNESL